MTSAHRSDVTIRMSYRGPILYDRYQPVLIRTEHCTVAENSALYATFTATAFQTGTQNCLSTIVQMRSRVFSVFGSPFRTLLKQRLQSKNARLHGKRAFYRYLVLARFSNQPTHFVFYPSNMNIEQYQKLRLQNQPGQVASQHTIIPPPLLSSHPRVALVFGRITLPTNQSSP